MKIAAACALFATCSIAATPEPPLEVKGVPLGATVQQLQQAIPQFKCYLASCTFDPVDAATSRCGATSADPAVLDCYGRTGSDYAFGSVHGARYSAFLKDGRIGKIRVTFPAAQADEVVLALTQEFGKPADDRRFDALSRLGETYANRAVTWRRSDGIITLERRAIDVDTGSATFVASWYAQATANAKEIAAQSGAEGP